MNKTDIEQWLKNHDIQPQNYTIHDDLCVDIYHGLHFRDYELKEGMPFQFGVIHGDFVAANNSLYDMRYFPRIVKGDVDVFACDLYSLKGCPERIGGSLILLGNLVSSFQHISKYIGGNIMAYDNAFLTLDAIPEYLGGELQLSSWIPGNWDKPYGVKPDRIEHFIEEFKDFYQEQDRLILTQQDILTIRAHHQLNISLPIKNTTLSALRKKI